MAGGPVSYLNRLKMLPRVERALSALAVRLLRTEQEENIMNAATMAASRKRDFSILECILMS